MRRCIWLDVRTAAALLLVSVLACAGGGRPCHADGPAAGPITVGEAVTDLIARLKRANYSVSAGSDVLNDPSKLFWDKPADGASEETLLAAREQLCRLAGLDAAVVGKSITFVRAADTTAEDAAVQRWCALLQPEYTRLHEEWKKTPEKDRKDPEPLMSPLVMPERLSAKEPTWRDWNRIQMAYVYLPGSGAQPMISIQHFTGGGDETVYFVGAKGEPRKVVQPLTRDQRTYLWGKYNRGFKDQAGRWHPVLGFTLDTTNIPNAGNGVFTGVAYEINPWASFVGGGMAVPKGSKLLLRAGGGVTLDSSIITYLTDFLK